MTYEIERSRPGREPCTILELYAPMCQLRYGETNAAGTCPAVLGTDSATKCYNTLRTCAVTASYLPAERAFRFSTAQQGIPPSEQIRPTIVNVDDAPRRLAPSKGLGEGAEARVTLLDHPWADVWTDPYRNERDYDPAAQGTFWGKFLARNPYYRGIRMRVLTGYISPEGFSLEDFSAREYIVDAIKGPDRQNQVTIVGTDIFRLLEKERSVVPAPSTGVLASDIDEAATSFTLSPFGIGDEEYPSEFRCVIGNEGFDVTRSGDACTVTQRGLYRGTAEHKADDSVQVVRRFVAQRVDQIAAAVITEAQPQLEEFIPTSEWEAEASEYLIRLYSADITKPTGVNELLAELMDSAPVMFWPNERARRIEMRAIKAPPASRQVLTDAGHFLADTLTKEERPKDRIDAALVYFGQLDPTEDKNKASNYATAHYLIAAKAQARYKTQQLRTVFSRWISRTGTAHAEDLADSYIRRYRETPLSIKFSLDAKHGDLTTGDVFNAVTRQLQSVTGAPAPRNFQVIEAHEAETGHRIEYEAESYDWWLPEDDDGGGGDEEVRVVISADDYNLNLRNVYDSLYATIAANVRVVINAGAVVGSLSTSAYALDTGEWPESTVLTVEWRGRVQGAGGKGGDCTNVAPSPGAPGGPAFIARRPVIIDMAGGACWGGGGGGGGQITKSSFGVATTTNPSGGGGGAGSVPGAGGAASGGANNYPGSAGTLTQGGAGGNGDGTGGDPAQAGSPGRTGAEFGHVSFEWIGAEGGQPGNAIEGAAFITWVNSGDILGAIVS